jgi:Tfp pilus assembly protein PilF
MISPARGTAAAAALTVALVAVVVAPPGRAEPGASEREDVVALARLFADQRAWREAGRDADLDVLARTATTAPSPFARAHAHFARARADAKALDFAAMERRHAAIGLVKDAWLLGPLDPRGAVREEAPHEAELAPFDRGARFAGLSRDVAWQRLSSDPASGAWDVDGHLEPNDDVGALLVFAIEVERETAVAIRVGSTAPVILRVGDVELARDDAARPLHLDQTTAGARLSPGVHRVSLRSWSADRGLDALVRVTAPDGGALEHARLSAAPEVLARARRGASGVTPLENAKDPLAASRAGAGADATPAALAQAIELEAALRGTDQRAQPTQLERWLEALVARTPESAEAALDARRALAAELGERDPSRARALLEEVLASSPTHTGALLDLAELYAEQSRVVEARRFVQRARRAAPDDARVLARALAFDDRHGALGADPAALFALAERAPTQAHLEAAAEAAQSRGDMARYFDYAARLLKREPASWRWVYARADAATRAMALGGEGSAAAVAEIEKLLVQRLALMPSGHATARALLRVLVGAGRLEDARALVAARRAAYPARTEPLSLAATLALHEGDRTKANEWVRAALALRPQDRDLRRLGRQLDDAGEAFAERHALDVHELSARPPQAGAVDAGAEVLGTSVAVRLFDNGLGQVLREDVVRVHDARKARGYRLFTLPYTAGREIVEVLTAERVTRGGDRRPAVDVYDEAPVGKDGGVYTDVQTHVVDLGELADGDVLHVRTRTELVGGQNLFGDFFGLVENIQRDVPVGEWRVVVDAPRERMLSSGGRGAPVAEITEEGERRVWTWRRSDVPRVEPEPNMPPFFEVADALSVSTYGDWAALGRWYADLVAPQLRVNAELRELAREVTAGAETTAEKVRRLYEHVVTETRYVGIELGIHGWKPYPVTEVHRRRYGDCKDKASLLVALLGVVDVDARLVLVRTADNGVLAPEPASMWAFNHAIAWVPELDLFLDGTAERSGATELPTLDQGAMALLVAPAGSEEPSRLVQIPLASADDHLNTSRYVLRVAADGTLSLRGSERFTGAGNAEHRRQLNDPATRVEEMQRSLASALPGAVVHSVEVTDLSLSARELGYDIEATIPGRATEVGEGELALPISLYPHGLVGSYARRSERKLPVWLDHPWRIRNEMRYVLPDGWEIADLPASSRVESEHLIFTQRIERTEDGFLVEEDTQIRSRSIPAESYAELQRAAAEADAIMQRRVRLRRSVAP